MENIEQFKELGIAGIAIIAEFLLLKMVLKQLADSRAKFESYVQSNNHTVTDPVVKATETNVEVKEAIKNYSSGMESHNELLRILINQKK